MKRFIFLLMIMFVASPVMGATYGIRAGATSTTVTAANTNIGTSFQLMATDESFAQLVATDSLHLVLTASADSVRVRVRGIDENGNRKTEFKIVKTDSAVTTTKFKYYEGTDIVGGNPLTGNLNINRATGGTHVSQIRQGLASDDIAQFFNDDNDQGYVAHWTAGVTSTTGTIIYELRFYYDQASARSGGNGYQVIDIIALPAALGQHTGSFEVPAIGPTDGSNLGWYSVWAKGGSSGSDGFVRVTFEKR